MSKKQLRKKLALMMANLKKKRKYYCELEYLESTGTQWIDTGTNASLTNTGTLSVDTGFVLLQPTASPYYTGIFGSYNTSGQRYGAYARENSLCFGFANGAYEYIQTLQYGTYYRLKFSTSMGSQSAELDGTVIWTATQSVTITNDTDIGLFCRNNYSAGNLWWLGNLRIYFCKIYDNGVLIRDMIPVLDWNMTPCMYDRVSGQLFYNQGTGSFTYGREIHYVDYLESTGTQYIDTGVTLTNNHSVEIDYQLTSASQNRKGIFGGLVVNGSRFGALLSPSNNYLEFGYGTTNVIYQTGLPDTQRHVMKQQKNLLYFDGTLIYTFNSATFTQNFTAPLGNFAYTNYTPASAKYYSSRWWDGDTLVRDYKPAIDENGVGFMFDRVSHTIYDNAGTGVFNYPARETEYTANAATYAYIDLGVKYKPSMTIEGKYTRDNYGTNGSVMLLTTTTTAPLIYLPALSGYTAERYVWRRPPYTEQSYFISTITYPFTCEMKVDAVNDTLTLNGDIVKTGMIAGMNGYDDPYESASNMYMFSIANSYAGNGKIYYLKIIDGTTPLFDLISAYKDGEAGFYNKIDGTFFKNASSSGLLTAGKIIEPEYE